MQHLIVVRPFGPWRIGDLINDDKTIASVLASEHGGHVVRFHPPEGI